MSEAVDGRLERIRVAMDTYQGRLVRYAARITGDLELARDVVQDTFLRLCRAQPEKTDGHMAAWLFRVCRNRALDVRKKEATLTPLGDVETSALPRDRAPDPLAAVERHEAARRVLEALGQLSPGQQEVLRLRYQEDLSYKEISGVTGHSVGNVGFLIHTGILKLRQQLNPVTAAEAGKGGRSDA